VVEINEPGVVGLVGFQLGSQKAAQVTFVKDGVLITSHKLKSSAPGFVAVVDGQPLRKDVSQADIIRDERYEAMLPLLREAGRRSLMRVACSVRAAQGRLVAGDGPATEELSDEDLLVARKVLRSVCGQYQLKHFNTDNSERLAYHLARAPLFRTISGEHATIGELIAAGEGDGACKVGFTRKPFDKYREDRVLNPKGLSGDRPVLYLPDDSPAWPTVKRIFGKRLVSVAKELTTKIQREQNRRRWRSRPVDPNFTAHGEPRFGHHGGDRAHHGRRFARRGRPARVSEDADDVLRPGRVHVGEA